MASEESSRPPFWRRALRRVTILTSTALTGALAVGLVLVGSDYIAANAAKVETVTAAPPIPVATVAVTIEDSYTVPLRYVGQIEPNRETQVAFEAGGTLEEVLVDEGDRVEVGTLLARLDTRAIDAEAKAQAALRDALEAQLELARLTEARQSRLAAGGASSVQRADEARLSVAELEARIRQIDAVLDGIAIAKDKAEITAPFSGRIGTRFMDPGAQAAPGAPVIEIFEETAPRLRVGVAAEIVETFDPAMTYQIEIAGETVPARFDRVRSDVDPVTRTVQALFALETDRSLPYGTLGELMLTRTVTEAGTWVPIAALSEGTRGLWTLLTLDDADGGGYVAAREAVEVLYADEARAFIRGPLQNGQEIIATGTHRVTPGQRIAAEG